MSKLLDEAEQLGMDRQLITLHLERVTDQQPPLLPIIDNCRLDNGGILPLTDLMDHKREYVAFVPAAGASTRFSEVFAEAVKFFIDNNYPAVRKSLVYLKQQGLLDCPLPAKLRELITRAPQLSDRELAEQDLDDLFPSPKALYPCVLEGNTFLDLKVIEQTDIFSFPRQVFVVPDGCQEKFKSIVGEKFPPILFWEQGKNLSTLRLYHNNRQVVRENNKLSVVPAGHGMLTAFFPQLKEFGHSFPDIKGFPCHSAFIRNIDNIMGFNPDAYVACSKFLTQHNFLIRKMQKIRRSLRRNKPKQANTIARKLYIQMLNPPTEEPLPIQIPIKPRLTIANGSLWQTLHELFHTPLPTAEQATNIDELLRLYSRPVNSLGQVANRGNDSGGIPVFADYQGQRIKICLETPHMTETDRHGIAQEATHFNPVFVACELDATYPPEQNPLWLLAEKNHRGQKVCYHETLLYETLSNSLYCNAVFIDVPREVFNPHKTLADAANKRLIDWHISR